MAPEFRFEPMHPGRVKPTSRGWWLVPSLFGSSGLVLLGLDLWASAGDAVVVPVSAWRAAGVASMAGGVYVFMVGVADRVFRGVGRRMSMWAVESAVLLVFLGGVAIAGVNVFGGF